MHAYQLIHSCIGYFLSLSLPLSLSPSLPPSLPLSLSLAASLRLSNPAQALAPARALRERNLPPQKHSYTVDKGTGLAQIEKAPTPGLPLTHPSYDDPP